MNFDSKKSVLRGNNGRIRIGTEKKQIVGSVRLQNPSKGYNPLTAIDSALNGNAVKMIKKTPRNNPANQGQKQGGKLLRIADSNPSQE